MNTYHKLLVVRCAWYIRMPVRFYGLYWNYKALFFLSDNCATYVEPENDIISTQQLLQMNLIFGNFISVLKMSIINIWIVFQHVQC